MSPCVYHHRTNIPHDSSSLHHHSNRLLRTPPKKTVSHNIAPFVPSDNVSPTIFLRHRFNRPRQKNDRKKRKKRSLAAIPDNATQKSSRVDVSAAKKIISSFCKRPSPPPLFSRQPVSRRTPPRQFRIICTGDACRPCFPPWKSRAEPRASDTRDYEVTDCRGCHRCFKERAKRSKNVWLSERGRHAVG